MCDKPEFDLWRWVDFWYPVNHVVPFKRYVYERALRHLADAARRFNDIPSFQPPANLSSFRDRRRPRSRSGERAEVSGSQA